MKFKLGEFVRFVDEKREGYITTIFDETMIGVTGDDDFEIPVPANKVTRVYGQMYEGVEDQAPQVKEIPLAEFKNTGVYLAMISDPNKGSVLHFHLLNETSFQLLLTLSTEKSGAVKGHFSGIVAPNTSVKVYSASLTDLNIWPSFSIQVLYYSTQEVTRPEPLIFKEKFKAKDFSGAKKQVPMLKQQGWLLQLDEEEIKIDAEKLKESFFKPTEEKKEIDKPQHEVDLHIEKLRDDHQFLSNREILRIQMEHFKKSLDAAIVHKLPSIIFIHGVGNGTLRHEIHKAVSKHQQVKTFMDAYKDRYGYGATEVILK
ncbi:DUF2027 domain-containing protein [Pedobacter sp. SYSU D00535]|uniref:Smr/MutS family protein n=1 Tax=Pedobacter sp. SYSU D00535 TaxID=2810308 RepID=UPI001A9676E6|nr:DUF2027 domain-containing protein [Pedobacter sp. SYSU D00535]